MRVEVMPSHDIHNFYLRWEVVYEGKEKAALEALGGPVFLEIDVSCLIDLSGNRHETAKIKVPIWPHAGPKNLGQSRFWEGDSRRRFWVNLQDAATTTVVDAVYAAKPGSVGKDGLTVRVPEKPGTPVRATPAPAAAAKTAAT